MTDRNDTDRDPDRTVYRVQANPGMVEDFEADESLDVEKYDRETRELVFSTPPTDSDEELLEPGKSYGKLVYLDDDGEPTEKYVSYHHLDRHSWGLTFYEEGEAFLDVGGASIINFRELSDDRARAMIRRARLQKQMFAPLSNLANSIFGGGSE